MISEITRWAPDRRMPRTAAGGRGPCAHVGLLEAHRLARARHQQHVAVAVGQRHPDQGVALFQLQRDEAAVRGRENCARSVFFTVPLAVAMNTNQPSA
jgi:hypothetical protein